MRLIDADELIIFGLDNPDDEHLFQFVPIEIIDSAPTVELPSAERTGKWIRHNEVKNVYGGIYIECSECGEKYVVQHIEDEKYCRHCGARMLRGE